MPTNVTAEYVSAEEEYSHASTIEEKIRALQKMLSVCPTHKGCEKLRQEIKTKIAKLKEKKQKELEKKSKGKQISIKKEGAATICLVGQPNSGKSTLLNKLTNSKVEINNYSFTTKTPVTGVMKYKGLKIQVVEIPAIIKNCAYFGKYPQFFSIIRLADLVVIVTDTAELDDFFKEFEKSNILLNEKLNEKLDEENYQSLKALIVINKKEIMNYEKIYKELCKYYMIDRFPISIFKEEDIESLKNEIWKHLDLIKIYTKEPGKKAIYDEPLCLKKGSTIKDMAVHIHKDFIKQFRFARIWGKGVCFQAMQVGLNHQLGDEDTVEIHLNKAHKI